MAIIFHNTSGAGKIFLVQNGTVKGNFNMNQPTDSVIEIEDTQYGIANETVTGLVKSSKGVNKVSVGNDGSMGVETVSTDIFAQGSKTLVLSGGGA